MPLRLLLQRTDDQPGTTAPGGAIECRGLPALIVPSRAPRYVLEAQVAAGLQRPVTQSSAWLILM
jgi:hypothetical protein